MRTEMQTTVKEDPRPSSATMSATIVEVQDVITIIMELMSTNVETSTNVTIIVLAAVAVFHHQWEAPILFSANE
jgi:hypothetical protein